MMVQGKYPVEIPETAEEWQLYVGMPGASSAAKRLATAARAAVLADSRQKAIDIMYKALKAEERFGALDTEPRRYVAERILQQGRGEPFSWLL